MSPVDSRIPLDTRQKFILVKNWKGISRHVKLTGANMFVRMLKENPDLMDLFKFDVSMEADQSELIDNESLQEHGERVMGVFDEAIQLVGDADQFFALLDKHAKEHAQKTGFSSANFWRMEEPFLYAVKLTLDERFTENMEQVYKIVIHLILQTMVDGFERETKNLKSVP